MNTRLRKHLVACALLAGLGLSAHAQTAPTPPEGGAPKAERHHGKFDPAQRAERMNKRLADLKQKLQITPNQEQAWASFSAAMQPPAQRARPDREALARMTTPDRIDHMRALREQRNAEMDRRGDATKAFYGQLSAEQQKTFDSETARMLQRRGMGHRHHHG